MARNQSNTTNTTRTTRGSNSRSTGSQESMMSHWGDTAKDRPLATAAAVAGAVGAGVFLWSKRNSISGQISRLSDQITDWKDSMQSGGSDSRELALTDGPNESSAIEASRATKRKSTAKSSANGGRTSGRATTGQSDITGQNMNAGRASSSTVSY